MAKPEQLYDKRLYERFMRRGELAAKDVEAHLSGLPDNEANAENIADLIYGSDKDAPEAPAAEAAAPAADGGEAPSTPTV